MCEGLVCPREKVEVGGEGSSGGPRESDRVRREQPCRQPLKRAADPSITCLAAGILPKAALARQFAPVAAGYTAVSGIRAGREGPHP